MPSNEQRRQAAKRKLERQLARRVERAKRRRIWGVGLTVIVVIAVVGLVFWLSNLGPDDSTAAANPSDTDSAEKTTDGPCKFKENPAEKSEKDVGMPDDPADAPKKGTVQVDLKTNQGDVSAKLDRAQAPCTVESMEHLVKEKFFDGTKCHRMTASAGLKVLQCGDPKGDGTGGPGYSIPDELPEGSDPGTRRAGRRAAAEHLRARHAGHGQRRAELGRQPVLHRLRGLDPAAELHRVR